MNEPTQEEIEQKVRAAAKPKEDKELLKEQKNTSALLKEIRDLKLEQKTGDIKFRVKWEEEKRKETIKTQILLLLAILALSLDLVQLGDIVTIINRAINLFG